MKIGRTYFFPCTFQTTLEVFGAALTNSPENGDAQSWTILVGLQEFQILETKKKKRQANTLSI